MNNITAPSGSNTFPDTVDAQSVFGNEHIKAPLVTANHFFPLFLLSTQKRLRLPLVYPSDTRGMNTEELLLPVLSSGFLPWPWLAGEPKAPCPHCFCPPTRLPPPSLLYVAQQQPPGLRHQLGRGLYAHKKTHRASVGFHCPLTT